MQASVMEGIWVSKSDSPNIALCQLDLNSLTCKVGHNSSV